MENQGLSSFRPLALPEQNNVFLIDWLTFVSHVDSVDTIKQMLGLADPSIPWEDEIKFRNGYPRQCYWNNITISYGAEEEQFYADKSKARNDMGICVNLSGQGCRAYETYGKNDWFGLFSHFFLKDSNYNITRIDLAYDDHIGILDINRIRYDVEDDNLVSKSDFVKNIWSKNRKKDITGLTVQVGSDRSAVLIRIYDKAAERDFDDGTHWIRTEIQLRQKRALVAAAEIFKTRQVGRVASGILRNYITFRTPSADSNKSRWAIAPYWDRLLLDMGRISLWISPGEPYNFSKTERWLTHQCGLALLTYSKIHGGLNDLVHFLSSQFERSGKDLPPKYKRALAIAEIDRANARAENIFLQEQNAMYHANMIYAQLEMAMDDIPEEWLSQDLCTSCGDI